MSPTEERKRTRDKARQRRADPIKGAEVRRRERKACAKWYRNNKEVAKRAYNRYAAEDWGRYAIREVKRRAKRKGCECTITADWLNERLRPMICEATGISLVWDGPDGDNPWAPSVDKIDPDGGYTEDNTQVTCWAYNWAKGKWSEDVISAVAHALIEKEKSLE